LRATERMIGESIRRRQVDGFFADTEVAPARSRRPFRGRPPRSGRSDSRQRR